MSTKIDLEFPFKNDWRLGYIVTNREDRKMVILFNNQKNRSTISYARYQMAVKLGRYLTEEEHVDHIDDDPTNDDIANLQILDPAENNKKAGKGRAMVEFECAYCHTKVVRPKGNCFLAKSNVNGYCSISCGAKALHDPKFDHLLAQTKILRIFKQKL